MPALETVARSVCSALGLGFDAFVAEGQFKETYRALEAGGNAFAVKVHRPGKFSQRAVREVEAMKACTHPNIGRLLSVDTHLMGVDLYPFSVEEFIEGGSLGDLLLKGKLLDRAEVLFMGEQLIGAVSHVHDRRLVHRDIKPDNIMLRADGKTPVLVDFGLVRHLDQVSLTQSYLHQGPCTPLYAAAEQLSNDKTGTDWRADQFALGVTLSMAAFGFHPYSDVDGDFNETVGRVAVRAPQSKRFLDAASAAGLPEIVKMTAAWQVQRHTRPEQLAAAWARQ